MRHHDGNPARLRPVARSVLLVLSLALAVSAWAGAQSYTVVADKSQGSYRVSEKVVGLSLPRDAVGTTKKVTGTVTFAPDGTLAKGSTITVDLRGLTSDSSRRDGFIQRSTLATATYPDAVLVPTAVKGLPSPLPTSGTFTFQVMGDLTVHGVTKSFTWDATATFADATVTLKATTDVTFDDFGLRRPVVGPILAVSDPIHLEVDLTLQRSAP